MLKKIKDRQLIIFVNILLLIYIITIGTIAVFNNWYMEILGFKNVWLIWVLLIMFIFELLSTITFQLRIYLTGKNKIRTAAILGAFSWLIAGLQGMILINGSINGIHDALTFIIKAPPISVATFSGILINNIYKQKGKL